MRLLILEDDPQLGDALATGLRQLGHAVDWFGVPSAHAIASPASAASATGSPASLRASSQKWSTRLTAMRESTAPGSRASTDQGVGNCGCSSRW